MVQFLFIQHNDVLTGGKGQKVEEVRHRRQGKEVEAVPSATRTTPEEASKPPENTTVKTATKEGVKDGAPKHSERSTTENFKGEGSRPPESTATAAIPTEAIQGPSTTQGAAFHARRRSAGGSSRIVMTPPNPLQKLRDLDRTSPHFHNQLTNFLRGNEYQDAAPSLQGEDLAWFVNYLDKVGPQLFLLVPHSPLTQALCDISDPGSVPFREPLDELRRICGVKNVLPSTCTISDSLLGCVYEGTFNGSKVRIRRVRTNSKGDPQKAKEVRLR